MNCSEPEFICISLRSKQTKDFLKELPIPEPRRNVIRRASGPWDSISKWEGVLNPWEERTSTHQWNTELQTESECICEKRPTGTRQVDSHHGPLGYHDKSFNHFNKDFNCTWRYQLFSSYTEGPFSNKFCLLISERPQPTPQLLQVRWLYCHPHAVYIYYFEEVFKKQGSKCRSVVGW